MIYTIWTFVNIGLLIYFLIIILKSIKLVFSNVGTFASIIFVIGLLSLFNHSNTNYSNNNTKPYNSVEFVSRDTVDLKHLKMVDKVLDSTLLSRNILSITYGVNQENKSSIPVTASTLILGLKGGNSWHIKHMTVYPTDDNSYLEYYVSGVLRWHILGLAIYEQNKKYSGRIKV